MVQKKKKLKKERLINLKKQSKTHTNKFIVKKNWFEHFINQSYNKIKTKEEIFKKRFKKFQKTKKNQQIEIKQENKKPIKELEIERIKRIIKQEKSVAKKEYITDLDLVVKIVEKYGKIKISNIASGFGVDKKIVEEWGKILEDHDFIKIHYPPIGEPEFIRKDGTLLKKIEKTKLPEKKRIFISLTVALVIIVGIVLLFTIPIKKSTEFTKIIEESISIKPDPIAEAFSGKASYICNTTIENAFFAQYFIKNNNMRIESKLNGKSSLMLIKEEYVYTYLPSEDKWIKKIIPDTIITPGSGKLPEISLLCEKADINDNKFLIPDDKILEI